MSKSELHQVFLRECGDHLHSVEQHLLNLREKPEDEATILIVFRAIHTIKGAAGMVGFGRIETFTHEVEHLLDLLTAGKLRADDELIDLLLACRDYIEELAMEGLAEGPQTPRGLQLMKSIQTYFGESARPDSDSNGKQRAGSDASSPSAVLREIHIVFLEDTFRNGFDPISFINYLGEMGDIEDLRLATDRIPPLSALDAESCYLELRIVHRGHCSEAEIRAVFDFVEDDSTLTIHDLDRDGSVDGEPATGGATSGVPDANAKQRAISAVRVEAGQLDQLVDLVGELLITGAYIQQLASNTRELELNEASALLNRQVSELRESTMQMRMVPIAVVFNRFRRVVHDLSRELKKEVRLEIRGAETRLDRSLTESVAAPLMHVVRNSMDHGVESREVRLQAGKAASATIVLNAYQEAGEVIIEVSDDGGGLNRGRIREHALAKNIIGPHEALSDSDTINLIFRPGFSTASQLTNVSGRGVGMDAVKRDIENLRGRIEIESREGSGTMIRFRLPLTLATIDGLLVRIHQSFCIVPLELVYECVEFSPSLIQSGSPNLINIRGEILPLVRLHDVFHMQSTAERRSIVVIHYSGQKAGLLVDELRGEIQSVVKAPGPILNNAGLKNGNSVLGDGSIATILDVLALLESMKQKEGSN